MATDLPGTYAALRSVLARHADGLYVTADTEREFTLDRAPAGSRVPATWFGGVRLGKRYVSYYLLPVYTHPRLLDGISSDLRRRMQGKSCFNFTGVDEALFAELDVLTARCVETAAT